MARVSVNIVTWNSRHQVPALFASLVAQTFTDFSILVIDNASTDGTIEFLRERYPQVTVLRNVRNLGFSVAHNQGIAYAFGSWRDTTSFDDHYVLVINPDTLLEPDTLKKLVVAADARKDSASFTPKLLRVAREGEGTLEELVPTGRIDSTGLVIYRSRRTTDRGSGEEDHGQYDDTCDVFGVSGAFALYRASALLAIAPNGEVFDPSFFAYQEDVDLAWRLQRSGFSARFVPESIAYHVRTARDHDHSGPIAWLRNRSRKSPLVNYLSYRNHWFLLIKNEGFLNMIRHSYRIVPYEFGKFCAILIGEPRTLRALPEILRAIPQLLAKRRALPRIRTVSSRDIRHWFF